MDKVSPDVQVIKVVLEERGDLYIQVLSHIHVGENHNAPRRSKRRCRSL
jgi:hypothetical protein